MKAKVHIEYGFTFTKEEVIMLRNILTKDTNLYAIEEVESFTEDLIDNIDSIT